MKRRSTGWHRSFFYTHQPMGEVMATDRPKQWQWFAFGPDRLDVFVAGVDTKREMLRLIDERLAKAQGGAA